MYKKRAGNDKQRKDAGNRTLCPYRNFSQAINGNIKIMPCVEGDRSDCQPEESSIARSRRLRAMVVVEG